METVTASHDVGQLKFELEILINTFKLTNRIFKLLPCNPAQFEFTYYILNKKKAVHNVPFSLVSNCCSQYSPAGLDRGIDTAHGFARARSAERAAISPCRARRYRSEHLVRHDSFTPFAYAFKKNDKAVITIRPNTILCVV